MAKLTKAVSSAYPDDNPKTAIGVQKPSLTKAPPIAMLYMALAFMDGARKYGPFNWREKRVTATIYIDAIHRHLGAWMDGEEYAEDSKLPHLAHVLACVAIIIDAQTCNVLNDDRPVAGAYARELAKWTQFFKDGGMPALTGLMQAGALLPPLPPAAVSTRLTRPRKPAKGAVQKRNTTKKRRAA